MEFKELLSIANDFACPGCVVIFGLLGSGGCAPYVELGEQPEGDIEAELQEGSIKILRNTESSTSPSFSVYTSDENDELDQRFYFESGDHYEDGSADALLPGGTYFSFSLDYENISSSVPTDLLDENYYLRFPDDVLINVDEEPMPEIDHTLTVVSSEPTTAEFMSSNQNCVIRFPVLLKSGLNLDGFGCASVPFLDDGFFEWRSVVEDIENSVDIEDCQGLGDHLINLSSEAYFCAELEVVSPDLYDWYTTPPSP